MNESFGLRISQSGLIWTEEISILMEAEGMGVAWIGGAYMANKKLRWDYQVL